MFDNDITIEGIETTETIYIYQNEAIAVVIDISIDSCIFTQNKLITTDKKKK